MHFFADIANATLHFYCLYETRRQAAPGQVQLANATEVKKALEIGACPNL
jgi:hypothetical protein